MWDNMKFSELFGPVLRSSHPRPLPQLPVLGEADEGGEAGGNAQAQGSEVPLLLHPRHTGQPLNIIMRLSSFSYSILTPCPLP